MINRRAPEPVLWGRADEVAALGAHARAASEGRGRLVSLVGGIGTGKSTLLEAGEAAAASIGLRVLRARAVAKARAEPWSLARQLLEPDLAIGAVTSVVEAVVDLTRSSPIALCVDDLHWADAASLQMLDVVRGRLAHLPILLLAATRGGSLGAWAADVAGHQIALGPLSPRAVDAFVRETIGWAPPELVATCAEVTGGNPWLLRELIRWLVQSGGDHSDLAAVRAAVPDAVVRRVSARIQTLGPDAVAAARAAAILGDAADVRQVGRLANLPTAVVSLAVDALIADGLVAPERPLRFTNVMLAAGALATTSPAERSALHVEAAAILLDEPSSVEAACDHLLRAHPGAAQGIVVILQRGAAVATARGAPSAAAAYLRRALAELPPRGDRGALTVELARVARTALEPDALELALDATVAAPDPASRFAALSGAGELLALAGRGDEALDLLDQAGTAPSEAAALAATWSAWSRRPGSIGRPVVGREPRVDAVRALRAAVASGDAAATRRLAGRAWADGELLATDGGERPNVHLATAAAVIAGDVAQADRWNIEAGHAADALGSDLGRVHTLIWRAVIDEAKGDLDGAAAAARASLELLSGGPALDALAPLPIAVLGQVALLTAGPADASHELDRLATWTNDPLVLATPAWWLARAAVDLAAGRPADALHDLAKVESWARSWPAPRGGWALWQPIAAEAHLALGDAVAAEAAAGQGVKRARRFGAPRPLARALRAAALVVGPAEAVPLLEEAVGLTDGGGCGLEGLAAHRDLLRARLQSPP